MKKFKPTLAIDLDGVIAQLGANGYFVPTLAHTKPIEGAAAAVRALIDAGWTVVIFTTRADSRDRRAQVMQWLDIYDIPYHDVTNEKPAAIAYIDDRAIRFDNWTQMMAEIGKLDVITEVSNG